MKLVTVGHRFEIDGQLTQIQPYGSGHINDTYLVSCRKRGLEPNRYVLQRINRVVFEQPQDVMHNMALVTNHLRQKVIQAGGDPARECLTLVPTREGNSYYQSPAGEFWRMLLFIDAAPCGKPGQLDAPYYEAAKAFGRFLGRLQDLIPGELKETIPGFHDTPTRVQAFKTAVATDPQNRARFCRSETAFALQRMAEARVLIDLIAAGKLPLRVVHNDAKIDNVLIDRTSGTALCVIDLDTIMPGLAAYDFGDLVRSAANQAGEDDVDLTKVRIHLGIFGQLVQGFLDGAADTLHQSEIESLVIGTWLITYEQSIRFLTDYLLGDVYYKTSYTEHNLVRSRSQLKLLQEIEDHRDDLAAIINLAVKAP